MKAPKCPKCGKEHYSTQRCSAEAVCGPRVKSPSTSAAPVGSGSKPSPDPSSAENAGSRGNAKSPDAPTPTTPPVPPVDTSMSSGQITNEVNRESPSGDQDAPVCGICGKTHPGQEHVFRGPLAEISPPLGDDELISTPLTPAEKQKAYRERHKDRVQEADRLRKRKQRDG